MRGARLSAAGAPRPAHARAPLISWFGATLFVALQVGVAGEAPELLPWSLGGGALAFALTSYLQPFADRARLEAVADESLRAAVEAARRACGGFRVRGARHLHDVAFASGWGPHGTVFVDLEATAALDVEALTAILVHEVAHLRRFDALRAAAWRASMLAAVTFGALGLVGGPAFEPAYVLAGPLILTGPLLAGAYLERRRASEFAADAYAARRGQARSLATALRLIRPRSPETWPELFVELFANPHPPVSRRIARLNVQPPQAAGSDPPASRRT